MIIEDRDLERIEATIRRGNEPLIASFKLLALYLCDLSKLVAGQPKTYHIRDELSALAKEVAELKAQQRAGFLELLSKEGAPRVEGE
jgi:hypothetical protein